MRDDPLIHVMVMVRTFNTSMKRTLDNFLHDNVDDVQVDLTGIRDSIRNSNSSRMEFYKRINPDCIVHPIYNSKVKVNELERISWTRMRVSAHSLAIERGRWNRRGRGRLPVEERICSCGTGTVQTEKHVIEVCPRTAHLRAYFSYVSVSNIFEMSDYESMCRIIHKVLAEYG